MKDLNSILGLVDGTLTVIDNTPTVYIYRDPVDVEACLWPDPTRVVKDAPIILTRNTARIQWQEK